jgi:hypothetical protein
MAYCLVGTPYKDPYHYSLIKVLRDWLALVQWRTTEDPTVLRFDEVCRAPTSLCFAEQGSILAGLALCPRALV